MSQERMRLSRVPEARSGSGRATHQAVQSGRATGEQLPRGSWAGTSAVAPSACSGVLTAQATMDRSLPANQPGRRALTPPEATPNSRIFWSELSCQAQRTKPISCPSCPSCLLGGIGRVTSYQFTMDAHPQSSLTPTASPRHT